MPAASENSGAEIVALATNSEDRAVLADVCAEHRWNLHFAGTAAEALAISARVQTVVICDRDLPGAEWRNVVEALASPPRRACVILASRVLDEYLWQEVIRRGGYDVLAKPLRAPDLERTIRLALSYWRSATGTHDRIEAAKR